MKMIVLRCSILAVIIFIPLTTIQHFIPPLSDCILADICNHTWIPECAEDMGIPHRRLFLDECDVWEYNCDNNVKYIVVNYSDCFGPVCLPNPDYIPKFQRQGDYLYREDNRQVIYSPTLKQRTTLPMKTKPGKRRYTPEVAIRRRMKFRNKFKTTTECAPCKRTTLPFNLLRKPRPPPPKLKTLHTTKRKTKRTTKHIIRRVIKYTHAQVIQTATIGTVVLKRVTVIKNGKLVYKVVKGYDTVKVTEKEDSDFLE